MKVNCTLILLDVSLEQDENSGERNMEVVSTSKILCERSYVDSSTFWSATSNHVSLSCSFTVRKASYANQKYAYSNDRLYEIKSTGKSSHSNEIVLNASVVKDTVLKGRIKNALGIV